MAEAANDLIVDDVLMADPRRLQAVLGGFAVHWVGVMAPLVVLEERERARGGRLIGTSRWQMTRVHEGLRHDLKVDTSRVMAMECAEWIRERFGM